MYPPHRKGATLLKGLPEIRAALLRWCRYARCRRNRGSDLS
nr:MAG TPA: hypothetical protein [Caudoviricetes sp.]